MGRLQSLLVVVCFGLVFSSRSREQALARLLEKENSFSNLTSIDEQSQSEVIISSFEATADDEHDRSRLDVTGEPAHRPPLTGAATKTQNILKIITGKQHWSYECVKYEMTYQAPVYNPNGAGNRMEKQTFNRYTREAPNDRAAGTRESASGSIQISWSWAAWNSQDVLLTVVVDSVTLKEQFKTQRKSSGSSNFGFDLGEVPTTFADKINTFFLDTGDRGFQKDYDDGGLNHSGYDGDCTAITITCDAYSAQCCFDFYLEGEFRQNENDVKNLKLVARRREQTNFYKGSYYSGRPYLSMPWTSTPINIILSDVAKTHL